MSLTELRDFFQYLKKHKVLKTQIEFAKQLNYGRVYVNNILRGEDSLTEVFADQVKSVFEEHYNKFSENYINTTLSEGDKLRKAKSEGRQMKGTVALPVKVQANYSRNYNNQVFMDELERFYFPNSPYDGDGYIYAQMEGDSMEYIDENGKPAGLPDGSWIIAERVPQEFWRKGLKQFYVHVVVTEDLFTIKRILQDNDKEIVLAADNELYGQERISLEEVTQIWIFKRRLDWNAPPPRRLKIEV